jgi:hypothetical protein
MTLNLEKRENCVRFECNFFGAEFGTSLAKFEHNATERNEYLQGAIQRHPYISLAVRVGVRTGNLMKRK